MVQNIPQGVTNYTIWGLAGPATWPLWLLLFGTLGVVTMPRRRVGRRLLIAGAALFLLFGLTPLGVWLIRPLETRFPTSRIDTSDVREIVVLAGAERLRASADAGRLEVSEAAERVIEGAAMARRFPAARLWIVGGVRAPGRPVTDSAWTEQAWRRLGIEPTRIVAIDETLNTCENAAAVGRQSLLHPPLLVTSAFHMPRAVACFRRAGVEPLIYPVDFRGWKARSFGDRFSTDILENFRRVDMALHEWIGLAWYRLSGRTSELYPKPR
jgi:uncharacterized SAM-binding protein YcdF (DUF218 family)